MALSLGLSKLDAICARLKTASGVDGGIVFPNNTESASLEVIERNNNVTPSDIKKLQTSESQSTSRRKSRKATVPRNLSKIQDFYDEDLDTNDKDELTDYKLNNQGSEFPPPDSDADCNDYANQWTTAASDDEEQFFKDASSSEEESDCDGRISPSSNDGKLTICTGESSPLDLSVGSKSSPGDPSKLISNLCIPKTIQNGTTAEFAEKLVSKLSAKSKSTKSAASNKDSTAVLPDYAETTMNELLNMYGLGEGNKSMPPHNAKTLSRHEVTPNLNKIIRSAVPSVQAVTNGHSSVAPDSIYAMYMNSLAKHAAKSPTENKTPVKSPPPSPNYASPTGTKLVFCSNIKPLPQDYTKYIKRYNNAIECNSLKCRDVGHKEHYHCVSCEFKVFIKKEEMVRHYKWHKKRDESLQHGFLRFSPLDDCSLSFPPCTHNGRQTHYHCMQGGCGKVYISTSDVQMHANYHRKDSAIIQEGFQRFRATEDCGTQSCSFYGQRTTHFHCRRSSCLFTFKNKADMEKHKSYHQKDEILGRDGFKKFMKYESCMFANCRFSKVSNHIHCVRRGCTYVLHSTAQLYSHKRKHERRDFENAYRKYQQGGKTKHSPTILPSTPVKSAPAMATSPQVSTITGALLGSPLPLGFTLPQQNQPPFVDLSSLTLLGSNVADDCLTGKISPVPSSSAEPPSTPDLMSDGEMSISNPSSPEPTLKPSVLETYADELNGDKLSDSLSLPIPKYDQPQQRFFPSANNSRLSTIESSITPPPVSIAPPLISIAPPLISIAPPLISIALPPVSIAPPTSVVSPISANLPAGSTNPAANINIGPSSQMPTPNMMPDKREEAWKSYLIRYTANDPCNSRCTYLYKDHYHCKVEGCITLFKSKDGVREHARFHDLQDRICNVTYITYDANCACPQNCVYSQKEEHYHCIWPGCTHVISSMGPTFGRLEHYRIHEFARAHVYSSRSKLLAGSTFDDEYSRRRRGRPPKYPRSEIPVVPKIEYPDEAIAAAVAENAGNNELSPIVNGFKMFNKQEPCPDEMCMYIDKEHFHCVRVRCHHATDRADVLNLHAKDFHNFINILDGFEFFDRNVNCRRMHCANNKANRHYHCIRPKCDYSFVRHSTMAQHNKKHSPESPESNQSQRSAVATIKAEPVPIAPALSPLDDPEADLKPIIKSTGTFFPLSTISKLQGVNSPIASFSPTVTSFPLAFTMPVAISSPVPILTAVNTIQTVATLATLPALASMPAVAGFAVTNDINASSMTMSMPMINNSVGALPLTVLLQKKVNASTPPSWGVLKMKMHYNLHQNCGRPFCKLKKKDHYHCFDCNQAFSDPARLRSHVGRHGIRFKRQESGMRVLRTPNTPVAIAPKSTPPMPSEFLTMGSTKQEASPTSLHSDSEDESLDMENDGGPVNLSMISANGVKKEREEEETTGDFNADEINGMDSMQYETTEEFGMDSEELSSSSRYGRKRTATKYDGFIDSETAAVKHRKLSSPRTSTAEPAPEGYLRFRFNEDCQYPRCAYKENVSHFHCVKPDCGYGFSDRTRIEKHTLRHQKIDSVIGDDFHQFRVNVICDTPNCELSVKASHFHCLKCSFVCTDTSKVLAHRKHHKKLDIVQSQGFQKFTGIEDCFLPTCTYYKKQTHYHCTKPTCNHAVLGPSHMAPHRLRHLTDSN